MNLDPDDEFIGSDNLYYLYKKATKLKIDVISFGFIKKNGLNSSKYVFCENLKKIHFQPEIINSYYKIFDYLIWNKLVKKKLFLKAFKIFKEYIYGEKWNYSEDEIWSGLIYKYANSMICVEKSIYIHNIYNDSLMRNKYNIMYMNNLINWIEMYKKILNKEKGKKLLINRYKQLIKRINDNITFCSTIFTKNSEIKNKYINIFKKIKDQFAFDNFILKKYYLFFKMINNIYNF